MTPARAAAAAAIHELAGPKFGEHIVTCLIAVAAMRAALIGMGVDPDEVEVTL
jgi:hypothetical protein